jgi:hypothetical protein
MSPDDLERKLTERPFQPFRIKLTNSSVIEVYVPGEVVMGDTSAIFPLEVATAADGIRTIRSWRSVALAHMVEFIDIQAKQSR